MRLVCVSDTHMRHEEIALPDGDVLIHAGDGTMRGEIEEIARFGQWLGKQRHEHKIFVAGNHDKLFETSAALAQSLLPESVTYLQDKSAMIGGVNFYGAPWQPKFLNWAFMTRRGEDSAEKWARIDPEVEVLITHGPPRGIGDTAIRRATFDRPASSEKVGCYDLSQKLKQLRKLKVHIFGHIHEGYGLHPPTKEGGHVSINAAICDAQYKSLNAPLVFDLRA